MSDETSIRAAVGEAREAALRLLEHQPRSRRDLERRLRERGFQAPAIGAALDRLEAARVLDDHAYAEGFVRRRLRLRPRSLMLLRHELRARGIAAAIIDDVLRQVASTWDETALARAALRRRRHRLASLEPEVRRRRAGAALRRLGFPAAVIVKVLADPIAAPAPNRADEMTGG